MTLRPDEQFVADCIVRFLGGSDRVHWQEGDDPPDIYLDINGHRIAIEVTQLSPISIHEDGRIANRVTEDSFAYRLCDELDRTFGNEVPESCRILIILFVPVSDPKEYSRQLSLVVAEMVRSHPVVGVSRYLQVAGEKVEIAAVRRLPIHQKRVVGIIFNQCSKQDILLNARLLLSERIKTKQRKLKNLAFAGPKWLALHNRFPLADVDAYQNALDLCSPQHDFERILLVSADCSVNELYAR